MTGRWMLFLAGMFTIWLVLIVLIGAQEPTKQTFQWLALAFGAEVILVAMSVWYLWRVRNETGEPASWLLWLFLFGAIVMFAGLLPGLIISVSRAFQLGNIVEYPGLVLSLAVLLIGTVPVTTSVAIWRRRHRQ